jgi:hypothetical protein
MTMLITFIAGLRAGDLWARAMAIGIGLAMLFALCGVMIYRHDQRVKAAVIEKINSRNAKALDAADAAQQAPQSCTGTWNRSAGKCER